MSSENPFSNPKLSQKPIHKPEGREEFERKLAEEIKDGIEQSIKFSQEGRIRGKIFDGFRITGNGRLDNMLESGILPMEARKSELIVVDRRRDEGLRRKIEIFRKITEGLPEYEKVFVIAQRIYRLMGSDSIKLEEAEKKRIKEKKTLLIGSEIFGQDNPGVCRHRALLFQVIASELGLDSSLVMGVVMMPDGDFGKHVWNEVRIGNRILIVDIMNPPGFGKFATVTYEDFIKEGGFPEIVLGPDGSIIEKRGNPLAFYHYFDLRGRILYSRF